jgi:hypothetical protein
MVRRRKSTTTLRSLSIADLQALLEKKISQERKKLPALQKKRDKLASQLEATIRAKRGGKMTIPAAIHQVLEKAGKPMKSADIRDAIIKQKLIKGRKKSFAAQVNIALNRHKVFKKKGRGVYSL